MLASMTGFVSKTLTVRVDENESVQLLISIKTLNSRFFESTCRLAPALNALETEFIKSAKSTLHRGHMYLNVTLSNPNCFKNTITLASSTARGYLDALALAKKQFNLSGTVTVNDLLSIPNIFVAEDAMIDEPFKIAIMKSFNQALKDLQQQRLDEGAALRKDLELRAALMVKHITAIAQAFARIHAKAKKTAQTKLTTLRKADKDTANMQGLMLYAELDKTDIHEEIVRFKAHLENLASLLHAQQLEKGRQLDFILQELAREINTITSKCPHAPISNNAISIKVEIEKCREQIQNIV